MCSWHKSHALYFTIQTFCIAARHTPDDDVLRWWDTWCKNINGWTNVYHHQIIERIIRRQDKQRRKTTREWDALALKDKIVCAFNVEKGLTYNYTRKSIWCIYLYECFGLCFVVFCSMNTKQFANMLARLFFSFVKWVNTKYS